MKKQAALLVSTLVLFSAVSMQPAHAFKLKFWEKKAAPAVVAPVKKEAAPAKKEVAPVKEVKETPVAAVKEEVKKVETKKVEATKPVAKNCCKKHGVKNCKKCAKKHAKKHVKKCAKKAKCAAKPVAKAPVAPAAKAPVKK